MPGNHRSGLCCHTPFSTQGGIRNTKMKVVMCCFPTLRRDWTLWPMWLPPHRTEGEFHHVPRRLSAAGWAGGRSSQADRGRVQPGQPVNPGVMQLSLTDHAIIKLYEPAASIDSGVADSCLFWLYASVPVKLLRSLLALKSTINLYDTGNNWLLGSSLESLGFILVILKKEKLVYFTTPVRHNFIPNKKLNIHSKMN